MKNPFSYNILSRSLTRRLRQALVLLALSLTGNAIAGTILITQHITKSQLTLSGKDSFAQRFENAYNYYHHSPRHHLEKAILDTTPLGCGVTVGDLSISLLVRDHHVDLDRALGYTNQAIAQEISFITPNLWLYTHFNKQQALAVQEFLQKETVPYSAQHLHAILQKVPKSKIDIELLPVLEDSIHHSNEMQQLAKTLLVLPEYEKFRSTIIELYQDCSSKSKEHLLEKDLEKTTFFLWLHTPWKLLEPIASSQDLDPSVRQERALELLKEQLQFSPDQAFLLLSTFCHWKEFIDRIPPQHLNIILSNPSQHLQDISEEEKELFLRDIQSKPWPEKTKQLAHQLVEELSSVASDA